VDLERLRFGDWVMGFAAVAVLGVMFLDWYEVPTVVLIGDVDQTAGVLSFNAWESFAVNDVILALAAVMALAAFVLTATQPTAAVPLALAALTTLVAIIALVLVTIRVIWPPDLTDGVVDSDRTTGAWLGLVAIAGLVAGCLASIRDERLPQPEHPVEPRLVQP
jgi:multisubunit Na+/H+ antiporter MnhF subunit